MTTIFTITQITPSFTATIAPAANFTVNIDGNTISVNNTTTQIITTSTTQVVKIVQNGIVSVLTPSVIVVDTFNGDGSTLQFQLTSPPIDADNVEVVVSGIVQVPDDSYTTTSTMVGSTLTGYIIFNEAPLLGVNNVTARYYNAIIGNNSGGTGSGVTSIIAGTGISVNTSTGNVTITATGGGSVTWATLGDKNNASGPTTLALGQNAGSINQAGSAIAIGVNAGYYNQGAGAYALGSSAGAQNQGATALAIGFGAGSENQGSSATAIGNSAGFSSQGTGAVAVGASAGSVGQSLSAVAVGTQAGFSTQTQYATAIGYQAGRNTQGDSAVAIGAYAGKTNQHANSVVINATGSELNSASANAFYAKPVRQVVNGSLPSGFYNMAYNPTTGEIIYWT